MTTPNTIQPLTPRREMKDKMVAWLRSWTDASYGVLDVMASVPRGGYVRRILFGREFIFDAAVTIWTPTRIVLHASGPEWAFVGREFKTFDDFKAWCRKELGAPAPTHRLPTLNDLWQAGATPEDDPGLFREALRREQQYKYVEFNRVSDAFHESNRKISDALTALDRKS